jgi:hypothetical protein
MSTRNLAAAVFACVAGAGAVGCVDGGVFLSAREHLAETRTLGAGGEFVLENVNGRVVVEAGAAGQVRIEADKAASSDAMLRQVRVEIDGEGDRVEVRTRLPHGGWLFGGSGRVDYRVTVPPDARVRVQTVNGSVDVRGLTGALRASTTNGSVEVADASGSVDASSVNGAIRTTYRTLDKDGRHAFSTTNGSINVSVPEGAGGRLLARNVNGSIDNDLPLASTSHASRHRLEGSLGDGRGSLELRTVNGSIHLRSGRPKT